MLLVVATLVVVVPNLGLGVRCPALFGLHFPRAVLLLVLVRVVVLVRLTLVPHCSDGASR